MELRYIHTFPELSVDEFEDLLEDNEFNQELEKLPNVGKRTLLEQKDLGGGKRHTIVRYEAKAVPEQAQKYIGGEPIGWIEECDFNRRSHTHYFKLIPTRLRDRVDCCGHYKLEPLSPKGGTKRTVVMNINVKMFGLGSIVERTAKPFLEANARAEERITREYIQKYLPKKKTRKK